MREHRIFGAPGTGKTTKLAELVRRGAESYYGSVLVTSFTRTAARELAGRDTSISENRIGTLHSFCFRALGNPDIAEVDKKLAEWNQTMGGTVGWHVPSAASHAADDPMAGAQEAGKEASAVWIEYCILRNQLVARDRWPVRIAEFDKKWREWKADNELVDFTELIEQCLTSGIYPQQNYAVLFGDEVQDYSPLELALVRFWGQQAEHWVLAGDDDQAIFSFRGATPDAFLDPRLPDEQMDILPRSYRLPGSVLEYSTKWIHQVQRRQEKRIAPRPDGAHGEILPTAMTIGDGLDIARFVEEEERAGRSVMVLTSCGFMLERACAAMRRRGIPFHNPYRTSHGGWNPLRGGASRMLSYMAQEPTWGDVWRWMEHVDTKVQKLANGAKKRLKELASDERTKDLAVNAPLFTRATGIPYPVHREAGWLAPRLLKSKAKLYEYAFTVLKARGIDGLRSTPKVVPGTIHSVKGGEADTVLLFPDISQASALEARLKGWKGRDSLLRLFYVGMTRTRGRLILARPSSQLAARWLPPSELRTSWRDVARPH